MRSGDTREHLRTLGAQFAKGLLLRFCLIGSASALIWVVMMLLKIESHGFPTALKGLLTASVLILSSLSWVFVTLWLNYKMSEARSQFMANLKWLRKLLKSR